jgi:hypothetical protein
MGQQFDELAKALASGQSRREALRKFVGGAAGVVLASLPGRAAADGGEDCKVAGKACKKDLQCCSGVCCHGVCCDIGEVCIQLNTGAICMRLN